MMATVLNLSYKIAQQFSFVSFTLSALSLLCRSFKKYSNLLEWYILTSSHVLHILHDTYVKEKTEASVGGLISNL